MGSRITITPQTIAAGDAATDVTVAVQVPAATASIRRSNVWALGLAIPLIGICALPFGLGRRGASRKQGLLGVLLVIVLASIVAMLGCGNSAPAAPSHQPTNYTLTVTATSGSVSHATTLTLTVR